MKPCGFPRALRLLRPPEFRTVFDHGRSRSDRLFIVYAKPHDRGAGPRLGLVVGRRFGGSVLRNELKRRLRETFRRARLRLPAGHDLIVLPALRGSVPSDAEATESLVHLAAAAAAEFVRRGPR
jgi:ribonuclease P protein component